MKAPVRADESMVRWHQFGARWVAQRCASRTRSSLERRAHSRSRVSAVTSVRWIDRAEAAIIRSNGSSSVDRPAPQTAASADSSTSSMSAATRSRRHGPSPSEMRNRPHSMSSPISTYDRTDTLTRSAPSILRRAVRPSFALPDTSQTSGCVSRRSSTAQRFEASASVAPVAGSMRSSSNSMRSA